MADTPGPSMLRELAAGMHESGSGETIGVLNACAEAWEAERLANTSLTEQLAAVQKQVDVLEQDRKWWKDNAIKRARRSAARRSGSKPRGA